MYHKNPSPSKHLAVPNLTNEKLRRYSGLLAFLTSSTFLISIAAFSSVLLGSASLTYAQTTTQPTSPASAQPLPFADTPKALLNAEVLAEFPPKTFLENLVREADESITFTSHEEGRLYRLKPGGVPQTLATISGKTTGIATTDEGNFVVSAFSANGAAAVFLISKDGTIMREVAIPDAIFLNGVTRAPDGDYLIADSFKGVIWKFQARTGTAQVWLDDPALRRANDKIPTPGANGVKISGNFLYVTNTNARTLMRFPMSQGRASGPAEILKTNVNLDDFTIDSKGTIYSTTHTLHSLVRIDQNGDMRMIGDLSSGMAGSTAVVLDEARGELFVTTNGGMLRPPEGGAQTGKLIRVKLR
jgi:sugar lactone lactonase YvrE